MTLGALAPRIGTLALRLLLPAGRGRVVASTAGAMFLLRGDGGILWIQGAAAPMHRRAIGLAAAEVPRIEAGAPFLVAGKTLWIGDSVSVDLAGATVWAPVRHRGGEATRRYGTLAVRIRELIGTIDDGGARELGRLLPFLCRRSGGEAVTPGSSGDPVFDAAAPHAIAVARACRVLDAAALLRHAEALIGLGRGLTPSGDDFVGGLAFVLRQVPGLCPDSFARPLRSAVQGWAGRTNGISFAMLGDHAAGCGTEVEHEIAAVLRGDLRPSALGPAAARLVGIGHSSGWDRLAGMVAGLSIADQREARTCG